MKNLHLIAYTLISFIYRLSFPKCVNSFNSLLVLSHLKIQSGNEVLIKSYRILRSLFTIIGRHNKIEIIGNDECKYKSQPPSLNSCVFRIIGNKNMLSIGSGVVLNSMEIVIRGNGNTVRIGDLTTCNSATCVCMGGGNRNRQRLLVS